MNYFLQALCELAVAQARHDWKQIKGIVRWCDAHYMEVACGIVGLPLLGLIILEVICWVMLREQRAELAELAMRLR